MFVKFFVVVNIFILFYNDYVIADLITLQAKKNIKVKPGDSIQFSCKSDKPIQWCLIGIPGPKTRLTYQFKKQTQKSPDLEYNGIGFDKGDCSYIIRSVNASMSGRIHCTYSRGKKNEFVAIVQEKPSNPVFKPDPNGVFYPGSTLNVSCEAAGGNPKPIINMFLNGVRLKSPVKNSARAVIVLKKSDHNKRLTCRVKHPAYEKGFFSITRTLKMYLKSKKPSNPVLNFDPTNLRIGNNLPISCEAIGGNPPAKVSIFLGSKILPGDIKRNGSVLNVTLTLSAAHENKTLTCVAKHNLYLGKIEKTSKKLDLVDVRPSIPILKFNKSNLHVGRNLSISCEAKGGNPPPNINIFLGNINLIGESSPDGSVINVNRTLISTDDGKILSCVSNHSLYSGQIEKIGEILDLTDVRPNKPVLKFDPSNLHVGNNLSISCEVKGGNPPPNITIFLGNIKLIGESSPDGSVLNVVRNLTVADEGKILTCVAEHNMYPDKNENTTRILDLFDVEPSKPELKFDPTKLRVGSSLPISCEAKGGNPPPKLTIFFGNITLKGESSDDGSVLNVVKTLTVFDEGQSLTCVAEHSLYPGNVEKTVVELDLFDVMPGLPVMKFDPPILLVGTNLTISCEAKGGNPPPRISIFLGSARLNGKSNSDGSVLNVMKTLASADKKKHLTCVAEHKLYPGGVEKTTELISIVGN